MESIFKLFLFNFKYNKILIFECPKGCDELSVGHRRSTASPTREAHLHPTAKRDRTSGTATNLFERAQTGRGREPGGDRGQTGRLLGRGHHERVPRRFHGGHPQNDAGDERRRAATDGESRRWRRAQQSAHYYAGLSKCAQASCWIGVSRRSREVRGLDEGIRKHLIKL